MMIASQGLREGQLLLGGVRWEGFAILCVGGGFTHQLVGNKVQSSPSLMVLYCILGIDAVVTHSPW